MATPIHDRDQCREDVGLRRAARTEPGLEHVVDPARHALRLAGRERSRVADDRVALLVLQDQLQLWKLGAQLAPVLEQNAIADELREAVLDFAPVRAARSGRSA